MFTEHRHDATVALYVMTVADEQSRDRVEQRIVEAVSCGFPLALSRIERHIIVCPQRLFQFSFDNNLSLVLTKTHKVSPYLLLH